MICAGRANLHAPFRKASLHRIGFSRPTSRTGACALLACVSRQGLPHGLGLRMAELALPLPHGERRREFGQRSGADHQRARNHRRVFRGCHKRGLAVPRMARSAAVKRRLGLVPLCPCRALTAQGLSVPSSLICHRWPSSGEACEIRCQLAGSAVSSAAVSVAAGVSSTVATGSAGVCSPLGGRPNQVGLSTSQPSTAFTAL